MPTSNRLAVTCFNRCIKVYEPSTLDLVGTYTELTCAPLALHSWAGGSKVGPARHRSECPSAFANPRFVYADIRRAPRRFT